MRTPNTNSTNGTMSSAGQKPRLVVSSRTAAPTAPSM